MRGSGVCARACGCSGACVLAGLLSQAGRTLFVGEVCVCVCVCVCVYVVCVCQAAVLGFLPRTSAASATKIHVCVHVCMCVLSRACVLARVVC